jgi:large subunit ribosomal protein L25
MMCNPTAIPHHIEVDVSKLEIGQNIHINDLELPEGARPVDKSNFTVLSIAGRAEEVAAPVVAAAPAAAPAAAKGKPKA